METYPEVDGGTVTKVINDAVAASLLVLTARDAVRFIVHTATYDAR
jgi:hypothetical protein